MQAFLRSAARVVPSERQMAWFDTEFYAFFHFGMNTFTGREWGEGTESPALFNPERLDCDQWAEAVKAAGARGMVITAKHHDGFCLWPSKYTEHSVKNSPWQGGKGDVVREVANACRRAGLKFGFYLSPWDRNCALYGTPAYNDYYKAQLTELLTEYGDVFIVWFDGACGEGPNGRKQEYDFPGYVELVRKYQPGAVIFNDHGPDVRWIGNESGTARFAEWAVMPRELTHMAEVQTGPAPLHGCIPLDGIYNTMPDLGALSNIMLSGGLCFCPAEVDMSIRPGWFYHPEEEPHSLDRLKRPRRTAFSTRAMWPASGNWATGCGRRSPIRWRRAWNHPAGTISSPCRKRPPSAMLCCRRTSARASAWRRFPWKRRMNMGSGGPSITDRPSGTSASAPFPRKPAPCACASALRGTA